MKGKIGIDEVGRGPLAGPVTVCAVYINDEKKVLKDVFGGTIRDSKKLKKDSRNMMFEIVRKNKKLETDIIYAVASHSAEHIDKNGINNSIRACMKSCLKSLEKKGVSVNSVHIQLDGGLYVDKTLKNQSTHIKGDENFVSIALASIIAKVTRDNYMEKLSKLHPEYAWESNSGYGTLVHRQAIKSHGITQHHRKSYLKNLLNE